MKSLLKTVGKTIRSTNTSHPHRKEQDQIISEMLTKNQLFLQPNSINYDTFGPDFLSVPHGKLVIFGIPKSGNAWLQSMLVEYFSTQPVITLDEVNKQGVLAIHDPYEEYMQHRLDFASGVCLIRDIRDVIASYFHYGKTAAFRQAMTRFFYEDFDSFYYEWFLSRCVPAHRLHTFASEYAERGIPIVRYERLQADATGELARLIARWGFKPDVQKIQQVVENHQLEKLKKQGLNLGYTVQNTHFRKGGWGNFLSEIPPHILSDINSRFFEFLQRWGYPTVMSDDIANQFRTQLSKISQTHRECNPDKTSHEPSAYDNTAQQGL